MTAGSRARSALSRTAVFVLVLAVLWGLWQGYRELWITTGWTAVPGRRHHDAVPPRSSARSSSRCQADGPLLELLFRAALFTAKEAVVGFVVGSIDRLPARRPGVALRVLQRGLMPYVVGSQTIPILAIAPMVVVGLGNVSIVGWTPSRLDARLGDRRVPDVLPGHGEHACAASSRPTRARSS